MNDIAATRLGFYLTPQHACSYLPGRRARTVFADPLAAPDRRTQTVLAAHGFRRSGRYLYRPACPGCMACVPARIPVADFSPNRSQRRTLKRNADVELHVLPAEFRAEHFALYDRYQRSRHPEGAMLADDPATYLDFFLSEWSDTRFFEFRAGERLLALAVVDRLDDALSAVYTFYEPAEPARSLGTLAILRQIEEARRLGLRWLYLGYWIAGCRKMHYKANFHPLELYRDGAWRRHESLQQDGVG